MKMKENRKPKLATVINSFTLTPNMQRVNLQSDEFKQLTTADVGSYIKLLFHPDGHTDISQVDPGQRPVMRTYTISELDIDQGEICVDFVKHHDQDVVANYPLNPQQGGYAITWAMNAKAGDCISIGGPGNSPSIDINHGQLLLIADMTALPAATAKIAQLAPGAAGDIVVQLADKQDMPSWDLPKNVRLHSIESHEPQQLTGFVTGMGLTHNNLTIWCACEFTAMKAIRTHFNEKGLIRRENSYFSSYWKQGVTEDGHKAIKHQDAQALVL